LTPRERLQRRHNEPEITVKKEEDDTAFDNKDLPEPYNGWWYTAWDPRPQSPVAPAFSPISI
jgi:hypothetical protein